MTTAKFVVISILCNLLNFGLCCPGLPASIGDITPDQDVEVGTPFSVNCSLYSHNINVSRGKSVYVNSSKLILKFNQKDLTENVYVIDPFTIQLRKENASLEDRGKYYCYLDLTERRKLICATEVTVGYLPLPVAHFSCISLHYENLTCSWTPQWNPVKTKYSLHHYIIYNKNTSTGMIRPCPDKISETSCHWGLRSTPPYRKNEELIHFFLNGTNSLGTRNFTLEFNHFARVLTRPPEKLDVKTITKNSISVTWLPPREMSIEGDFLPGLTYQLQYKSEYSHTWEYISVNKTKQAEILGLLPFTNYDLKLRCRSTVAYTDDMWSNFTTDAVQTKPDIPYIAPETVQGIFEVRNFQGKRNITIHWKPVSKMHWNGEHFHYRILYYETYRPMTRFVRELSNKWKMEINPFATFVNLNSNTDYVFLIKSANDEGMSDKSSRVEVSKKENMTPSPKDIIVTDYGQGMYQLSWSMPKDPKLNVDNYTVFWCETIKSRLFPCIGQFQWTVVPKNYTVIKLNLSNVNTNYQFAISANTKTSSSGLAWAPCVVPYNGVLNKIEKVLLQSVNSTSLKVVWYLDCIAQRHVIKGYHIYICEMSDFKCQEKFKTISFNNSEMDSYVITGLKPFTKYGVAIAAVTSRGISEQSEYRTESTKAGAPSDPPQNVTVSYKNDTAIELTFFPPNIKNGIITHYDIRITTAGGNLMQRKFKFSDHKISVTIDKLVPYTNYTIEIKACVDHYCSPPSIINEMTDISVPGTMEPPIPEVYNASFVQLSWIPPQSPNGPISFYTLHVHWEDNNELQNQSINITNDSSYYMSIDCPLMDKDILYSFTVQAANIKNDNVLYGNLSGPTQTKLCYISSDGFTLPVLIGIIAGAAFGLIILIFLLYAFARWMKRKVDRIKDIKVQLPPGLESPHCNSLNSYENFKNGLIRKASESNLSPQTLYGRLSSYASDEGDPKDPPDSDASQFSNNSTEELLYKKKGHSDHGGIHSSGDCNTGKGHDSISSSLTNRTQLSSDSGAETDVIPPPSPESDNGQGLPHSSPQPQNKSLLPKVDEAHSSDSKDSGLEKEEGGNEKESISNHYSRFVCYLDNPEHPYNQRKILDRNSGTQQLPYSKFGVNMPGVSGYIPLANSLVFMSRSLANSEPSVMDVEKIKDKDQEITTDMVAPPYSKYGLARSFGEALNMPIAANVYNLNDGYSKCGVASNVPCFQNSDKSYIATDLSTPGNVPNPSRDLQLTEQSKSDKSIENVNSLPPSWTNPPKSNGYVTVDKLINPNKVLSSQPADGTAYSRLGTKPEIENLACKSKGYVSVQDAKDMLSGKEKINQIEPKEHSVGIPGYSKFDIQCDRLENSNIETMDPVLTGTKPKIYPNNIRQGYVPYCGFSDTNDNYMCNKNPNLEINGQSLNDSIIFPMEEDSGNVTPNLSPTKYLAQPKVHEPKNGYVQINPEISPDSIKIVPSDAHMHSSLTDTAV